MITKVIWRHPYGYLAFKYMIYGFQIRHPYGYLASPFLKANLDKYWSLCVVSNRVSLKTVIIKLCHSSFPPSDATAGYTDAG